MKQINLSWPEPIVQSSLEQGWGGGDFTYKSGIITFRSFPGRTFCMSQASSAAIPRH